MDKKNIRSIVPLLPSQQQMLSASLKGNKAEYVQQLCFEIKNFSKEEIYKAIERIVSAYECLGSQVLFEGLKQPVLVGLIQPKINFQETDLEMESLEEFSLKRIDFGFSFQQEPLIRFDWIQKQAQKFLLITNHHLLFDGWGRQQILGDFIKTLLYPKIFLAPKTNKAWYDAWKKLPHDKAISAYSNYLLPDAEYASFSTITSSVEGRGEIQTQCGFNKIEQEAKSKGLTVAEFINFSFAYFISKWTSETRVQLGVVRQNGLMEQVQDGFGLAIQSLPLQLEIPSNKSVDELIETFKNRERTISPYAFVDLTNELFNNIRFSILIAFENYPIEQKLKEVEADFVLKSTVDFSEFPLSIAITPDSHNLTFLWHFNRKYHSNEQIRCISDAFMNFLNRGDFSFQKPFEEISEQEFLIPTNEVFFERIEKNIADLEKRTYYQLLLEKLGLQNYQRVWSYGDKHDLTDVLIVACLKSAVELIMVNEKETDEFIDHLFEIAPPDLIFASEVTTRFEKYCLLDDLDKFSFPTKETNLTTASHGALGICTSGSTGKPKVVELSLNNLIAFFSAWENKLPWRAEEIFGVIAHPAFDIGVAELIFPLIMGWKKHLITKAQLADTSESINAFKDVTTFHMVPSVLENWISQTPGDERDRIVMTGGDKVPQRIQQKLKDKFPQTRLFQFYGPSECSILMTGFENQGQFDYSLSPLGTSFDHGTVTVVDKKDEHSMPFQQGEIVIKGKAVGMGYKGEKTSPKFSRKNNINTFRTGDLGFVDNHGNLFFSGRRDFQIKINGQRVEISRIETALIKHSGIQEWIVVYAEPVLGAFYLSHHQIKEDLKENLKGSLPLYAIPQVILSLNQFPTNKNGKIDTNELQIILQKAIANHKKTALPKEYEELLSELFPSKKINSEVSWFANGLNSIDAMKFSGKIKASLQKEINIEEIITAIGIYQIPSFSKEQSTSAKKKLIEIGNKVHDAAARIFFLSESDTNLDSAYWIKTGFTLEYSKELIDFISEWSSFQDKLFYKVTSIKNAYYWAEATNKPQKIVCKSELEFIQKIESTPVSAFESLLHIFYSHVANNVLIAFNVHHGLLDGLGVQQLIQTIFNDFSAKQITQVKLTEPQTEKTEKEFWKDYLRNVTIHKLPFYRNQPQKKTPFVRKKLDSDEQGLIRELMSRENCSTYEAGLVLWVQFWCNYFPSKTFATGLVVNTHLNIEGNEIPAMGVNTLPFVISSKEPKEIIEQWRKLAERKRQPFADIAQLETKKQNQGTPFFNTTFVHNIIQETDIAPINFGLKEITFDLSVDFIEQGNEWYFQWEFNPQYLSMHAIEHFHRKLFQKSVAHVPKVFSFSSIENYWQQVLNNEPNKIALQVGKETLSYAELNELIQKNRNRIQFTGSGILPLILKRTISDIAFLFTCIIEKIPFIPIDSDTPSERISSIESLCNQQAFFPSEMEKVEVLTNSQFDNSMAYAIATSGTTGVPKLVGIKREGYESAIQAWKEDYGISNADVILQATSFSFDVFLGDIGRALFNGAKLIVLDKYERKDPSFILKSLETHNVTIFETTPLIIRWWLNEDKPNLSTLRLLIVGSDSWKNKEMSALISQLPEELTVINSYGLSETTIDNSIYKWSDFYHPNDIVSIGQPMQHSILEIVNENGDKVSDGKEGYIKIDGPCVGKGYFQDGKWTHNVGGWTSADRGVKDEFGNFHFLGRSDKQVKIRGQRLELAEIERIFNDLAPETSWVAFAYNSGMASELGVAHTGNITNAQKDEIIKRIMASYASYYVPSKIIAVERFETTANGKINIAPLIALAQQNNGYSCELKNDVGILESLLSLMQQLFNIQVSKEENFFSLGLSSFDAMFFVREWNKQMERKLQVFHLFTAKDFKDLSTIISLEDSTKLEVENKNIKANIAQEAIWYEIQDQDSSLFNLPHFIEIPPEYQNIKELVTETLRHCEPLFSKFELTNTGDLNQILIDSSKFEIEEKALTISAYNEFKKEAFFRKINLSNGPCFEAAILNVEDKKLVYFNPHHIVYDGGSDEVLSGVFHSVLNRLSVVGNKLTRQAPAINVSWKNYFQLSENPIPLSGKALMKIEENYRIMLPSTTTSHILKIQQKWKCSQSAVYATLIGEGLKAISKPTNWVSLVVDTREEAVMGMFMRAFPIPTNAENIALNISQTKAALEFVFKHKNNVIIYPKGVEQKLYHQVGLVIQHPLELAEDIRTVHDDFSRARLPLTLYVERVNSQTFFRWEFDSGYFSLEEIKNLQNHVDSIIEKLADLEVQEFEPIQLEEELNELGKIRNDGIARTIWEKYLGKNADNDFFVSGGNSLKALMLLNEIRNITGKSIPPARFLKNPTFNFLSNEITKVDSISEQLWVMSKGEEGEDWYLPPIFGLALIYNTYSIRQKHYSVSFNYPAAINSKQSYFSITELAEVLLSNYLKEHTLPPKIDRIVAYSMGGLVGFELIKLLEEKGVQVAEFVIWDKSAQKNKPKNSLMSDIKLADDLLHYVEQLASDEDSKQEIINYLIKHQYLIESYHQKGEINTDIQLKYCAKGFTQDELTDWGLFTSKTFLMEQLPAEVTHYEIPKYWK